MKDKYDLILFDLDGTLIEFHHDYLFSQAESITVNLRSQGVARQHLEESFSSFDFFRFIPEVERAAFIEDFWAAFDWDNFPKANVLPGCHDTLSALKGFGVELGLVTSRLVSFEKLSQDVSHTGLLDFMTHVRTRTCNKIEWHDKRPALKELMAEVRCDPKRVVMVGDIPPDIESARDVGIAKTVAVLTGGIKEEVLKKARPDEIITDISLLREVL